MIRHDFDSFRLLLDQLSERFYRTASADLRPSDFCGGMLREGEGPIVTFGMRALLERCCRWTARHFPEALGFYEPPLASTNSDGMIIGWYNLPALTIGVDELIRLMIESGEFPEHYPSEGHWSFLLHGLNLYFQHKHPRVTRKEISFYWPRDLGEALPRLIQWEAAGHLRIEQGFPGTDPGDRVIEMLGFIPG